MLPDAGTDAPPRAAEAPGSRRAPASPARRLLDLRRPLLRMARTSTFRLAVLYMMLFGASVLLLLGFIYASTVGVIERQVSATIEAEIRGLEEQYSQRGLPGLVRAVAERSAAEPGRLSDGPSALYLLLAPDGTRLAGNLSRWPAEDHPEARRADGWLTFPVRMPVADKERAHQVLALTFLLPSKHRLLVGRDMRERLAFQEVIEDSLVSALAITLILGMLGGLLMSRNMLRRLDVINRTCRQIVEGHLSRRIPVADARDEFDRLAANLNGMLDRIERLMAGMREVTDNVAHDLRSPLSRLRSRLEVTLMSERDPDRLRAVLQETIGEADRLLATFNALLSIARLESGAQRIEEAPVDLADTARDAGELYAPVIEDSGLALEIRATPGQVVMGDRHLLTQAIANLLDNASKYAAGAPPGGRLPSERLPGVRLIVESAPEGPRLVVEDDGPGIPSADRIRVLERYVRLETSRTTPGNGLGLSLVAAVARLHGAALTLEATHKDGHGLRVAVQFPRAAPAARPAIAFKTAAE
ncbi:MAG: HAMP domain-containing histidine kinase [Alphaproteobacteria bacterium]|nr:HAMP domain-containing histidine kinase [Alphaproteobacteria bacterium]